MITYRLENTIDINTTFRLASFLLLNGYVVEEGTEICQNYVDLYMKKDSQSIYVENSMIKFANFTPRQSVEVFEKLLAIIKDNN